MRHANNTNTVEILHKIKTIENEVMNLKLSVLKGLVPSEKKAISLKGILKEVEICK